MVSLSRVLKCARVRVQRDMCIQQICAPATCQIVLQALAIALKKLDKILVLVREDR